jgi:hypothetical protein
MCCRQCRRRTVPSEGVHEGLTILLRQTDGLNQLISCHPAPSPHYPNKANKASFPKTFEMRSRGSSGLEVLLIAFFFDVSNYFFESTPMSRARARILSPSVQHTDRQNSIWAHRRGSRVVHHHYWVYSK